MPCRWLEWSVSFPSDIKYWFEHGKQLIGDQSFQVPSGSHISYLGYLRNIKHLMGTHACGDRSFFFEGANDLGYRSNVLFRGRSNFSGGKRLRRQKNLLGTNERSPISINCIKIDGESLTKNYKDIQYKNTFNRKVIILRMKQYLGLKSKHLWIIYKEDFIFSTVFNSVF